MGFGEEVGGIDESAVMVVEFGCGCGGGSGGGDHITISLPNKPFILSQYL